MCSLARFFNRVLEKKKEELEKIILGKEKA